MRFKTFLLSLIFITLWAKLSASDIVVSSMDKSMIQAKLDKFATDRSLPMGDLVLKIGLDFLNTPYVAKTLDKSKEEQLVINLHQLDCTTFAENGLALARTVRSEKPGIETFCTELESIRYRGGKLNGYASRLHYFSEWIADNEIRHHVQSMAAQMGGKLLP
ncbi:MAG TPA: N-acetylmuramoyl-L-alanine amidase-like domain-containing protein, partial [Prolixibacteraceae bacterium]|nr:N-acetylmuramoyl-L-alanine amidase-like domain-containing protein [Prolixibacteraceae bacterium]